MKSNTNIAALREAVESAADCGYTHRVYVDGRLLESLLDALEAAEKKNALVAGGIDAALKMQEQIEAERQRADEYKGQLELEQHLSKTLSGTVDIVDGQRDHWMERARKAEAENSALKAKLANLVVLPAGYSARAGHPFHEGERNVMIPNKHGDWLSRFEVEHAIHVAGFPFTNKDGD